MGLMDELKAIVNSVSEAEGSVSKLSDALKKAYGAKEARSIMLRLRGPRQDAGAKHKAITAINVWVHDITAKKRILGFYKLDGSATTAKHVPAPPPPKSDSDKKADGDKKSDSK